MMRRTLPLGFVVLGSILAWGCGDDDASPGGALSDGGADGSSSGKSSSSSSSSGNASSSGSTSSSSSSGDGGSTDAGHALAIELVASPATALADGNEKVTITVTRRAPNGEPISGSNVALEVTGKSNTLTPKTGATNAQGLFVATLTSTFAETKSITAASDALLATTSVSFSYGQGKLSFTKQPATVVAGVPMTPAPEVTLLDAQGNPIVNAPNATSITVALSDNTNFGWLAGQTTYAVARSATYPSLSVSEPGTGYHLIASAPGFIGATSDAFDVTAGAWKHLASGPPGIQDAQSLAIDPNDGTLYMTTADGVWRSDDAGVTFAPLKRGLASNSKFAELWVDPSSSHVYGVGPGGFYVSTDRGRSWTNKRQAPAQIVRSTRSLPGTVVVSFGEMYVSQNEGDVFTKSTGYPAGSSFAMAFDPLDAQKVYAGNSGQLYVSSNAGTSFSAVGSAQALPIVGLEATTSGKLFMAADYGGILSSTNGGQSFSPVGTVPTTKVNSLAVDPSDPLRIYAGTYDGFLRTANGGTDWSLTTPSANKVTFGTLLDPRAPASIYTFDGLTLLKSTDHGVTFASPIAGSSFTSVRSMVAAGTSVFATAVGLGVWKSTDGGATWTTSSTGLPTMNAGQLTVDPADASRLFVTTDKGIHVTTDGGAHWTKATSDLDSYSIGLLAIASGGVMYAASSSSFHKSVDSGATWTTIYPTYSPQITGLAATPADANTVYLSTTGALRKSTTGGGTGTWSSAVYGTFLNVILDPADANHVYASESTTVHYTTNGFTDATGTGASLTSGVLGAVLAMDPANASIVYVARDGARVWKSTDGGAHYVPISSGLYDDVETFAIPTGGTGTVYAGTIRSGIFKTTTGGE